VVPLAFDWDVDDTVSESHCSDGTSCIAGARQTMSFDYIDVHLHVLDNCSGYYYYYWHCSRRVDCSAADAAVAAAVAFPDNFQRQLPTALGFDSELDLA
jgi:hypothetical protein